jgi:hypothetical protein
MSASAAQTTAIVITDTDYTNAISIGDNVILGTTAAIDFSEFDVSATTGSVTVNDGGDLGNISIEGTILDINSLDFTAAGSITTGGTSDLTLDAAGSNILLSDAMNAGGATAQAYNFFASDTTGATTPDGVADLYIQDELEVDGTIRFNNLTYTFPSSETAGYILRTNGSGTLTWVDPAANAGYWTQASGALYPNNSTVDLLIGATSTASAKFAAININSGTPTATISAGAAGGSYLNATGTLATTALQTLTLATTTTGNISIGTDATARTLTLGNTTGATAVNFNTGTSGSTLTTTSTGDITFSSGDDLIVNMPDNSTNGVDSQQGTDNYINITTADAAEAITIGNSLTNTSLTFDRGSSGNVTLSDFITCTALETNGSGVLACGTDDTGSGGSNWRITSGGLSPVNDTLDLLIGNSATTSAKFGVLNVNSGTPTATISANSGNNASYLSGTGTLSTTNAQTLTIGGSTTGNITIDSGSSLITLSDNTVIVDNNWIGFGASAGRIEFDDQTTDEVNILSSNVGIGTQTPTDLLTLRSDSAGATAAILRLENLGTATLSSGGGINYYANRTTGGSTNIVAINGVITSIDNTNYAARIDLRTAQAGALTTQLTVGGPILQSNLPLDLNVGGDVGINYDLFFLNTGTSNISSEGPLSILAGDANHAENLVLGTQGTGDVIADVNDVANLTGGFKVLGSSGVVFRVNAGGAMNLGGSQATLAVNDTTPDVSADTQFITANTVSTLISDFDAGTGVLEPGHLLFVEHGDANTDYDCTASGINCGSTDITTTASGDFFTFMYDGTDWHLVSFMDDSDNQNAGSGFDIAELFPSKEELASGDLVSVDTANSTHVKRASGHYNGGLIGVVSTAPAITLGEGTQENVYPIGLAGRVPIKVSLENGSIQIGDYLTSSSTPGVAMKATKPGMVIGMALETFGDSEEDGKVLVFINPQWSIGTFEIAADGNLNSSTLAISNTTNTTNTTNNSIEASSSAQTSSSELLTSNFDLQNDPLFKDLSDKVGVLEARINNLAETTLSASTSALLSSDVMLNSFQDLDSELRQNDKEATISGTLAVLGRTTLNDLGVTGNINAGLLAINGLDDITSEVCRGRNTTSEVETCVGSTINTLSGNLYLQNRGLGGIDMLNGKIVIDTKGNIEVSGTITAEKINIDTKDNTSASIGSGILKALETSVTISSTSATKDSKIFLTSTTPTGRQSLFVKKKTAGVGFVVAIEDPYESDITFDWWVVN